MSSHRNQSNRCGNRHCSVSTGYHGGLTFGCGSLDAYGYWSRPCRICAADRDARGVLNYIWEIMNSHLFKDKAEAERYIVESEWLRKPAWTLSDEQR